MGADPWIFPSLSSTFWDRLFVVISQFSQGIIHGSGWKNYEWYLRVCGIWCSWIGMKGTIGPWWRCGLYWVPLQLKLFFIWSWTSFRCTGHLCGEFLEAALTWACGRFGCDSLQVRLLDEVPDMGDVWTGDDRRALLIHTLVWLALLELSPPLQPDGTEEDLITSVSAHAVKPHSRLVSTWNMNERVHMCRIKLLSDQSKPIKCAYCDFLVYWEMQWKKNITPQWAFSLVFFSHNVVAILHRFFNTPLSTITRLHMLVYCLKCLLSKFCCCYNIMLFFFFSLLCRVSCIFLPDSTPLLFNHC